MVDPVQGPAKPVAADNDDPRRHPAVGTERAEKFRSAMIAAALRSPMVTLAGANGEPDDDIEPPNIPMKAPVIAPTKD